MVDKSIEAKSVGAQGSASMSALKLGAFLFLLSRLAATTYGALWGGFSVPMVKSILLEAQFANIEVTLNRLLGATLLPLNLAVLVVLAPLFGWWVYSKIATEKQMAVGWGGALVFGLADAAISLIFSAASQALGFSINIVGLVIGEFIVLLWIMFFMGLGFNIAKLFKAKL